VTVTPHVSAAWQHAFGDVRTGAALAFASTGIGFTVTGVPLDEETALIEAGLDFNLSPTATLGVSYAGQFGDDVEDNAVQGRFAWRF
jgi:outer membrane autotransporter protein